MEQNLKMPVQDGEISIKDLFVKIQLLLNLFKRNILLIALVGFLFSVTGFCVAFFSNEKYVAVLRFVVKSEGASSGMSGMLGGLGVMLGASSTGSPLERTIEIAGSDRIVGSALLSRVKIGRENDILANFLIKYSNLHQIWKNDPLLRTVKFSKADTSIEKMSFEKRKALKKLEALLFPISGEGIVTKSFDKKSGVVTLSARHSNEDFSIVLIKEIYNKLRDFYVDQMTTSAANNVLVLQKKVDSIKFQLSKVQSSYARNTDQSFGLLFQEDKVELKKLAVREQMLLAMYAEAQKNLETFRFMNDSAIPSLTVIDMPYSPLKKVERGKVLFALVGFFLGLFLSFLFISFRHWYQNIMAS
jgi:hypothetical protein